MGFRPLKEGGHWACVLICAAALFLSEMSSFAQSTTTLRGKILSFSGQQLTVSTPAGDTKALLTENTVIRTEVPVDLSDIKPGMYLGTTATRQPDGTFLASEVHIFSEDQRGTGEGHRPLGSDPRSGATMTNANVERVEDVTVQEIQGRLINLKYPGGEIRVFIPPKIPIVKRVVADQTALMKGAEVSLQTAARTSDGTPAAAQITVRAAGR
ncbi:MAG: hypothetical protein ACTHLX_10905 [Candidatus Binatia bacterium]